MNSVQPTIDVEPEHWSIIQRILRQHLPGVEVWAFGSRAKGAARPYSDLLGINRMSYNRLERGQGKVITLIAALRALGKLDQLDAFLPNEPFSPMEALKMGRPQRMRARPKDQPNARDEGADW